MGKTLTEVQSEIAGLDPLTKDARLLATVLNNDAPLARESRDRAAALLETLAAHRADLLEALEEMVRLVDVPPAEFARCSDAALKAARAAIAKAGESK